MRQSPWPVYGAVFILLAFSLTTIWSTASHLFSTQLLFIFIGLAFAYLAYKIDLALLFSLSYPLYFISLLLLLATLVFGEATRGSVRWLNLGPATLQTSEIAKPFLSIFLVNFLANHPINKIKNFLLYLILLALPVGLVFIQPDLGSAMVIAVLGISLLFVAGLRYRYLILGLICTAIITIPAFHYLQPYQQVRLKSFASPYSDPSGSGYNLIQSIIAVGSGKLFGLGVKQGTQSHLKFLPERHTDFIYASFAEEFGFIGSTILFFAYSILFYFWFKLAEKSKNQQELYLSSAIFTVFAFQTIVNLGMNLGVLPVTGITLPFISYGGNSLVSLFILLGLSFNLSRQSNYHL